MQADPANGVEKCTWRGDGARCGSTSSSSSSSGSRCSGGSSSSTMLIPRQESHNETFLTTPAPRCKTRQGEWRQASNHGEPTNVSISDIEQSARTKTKGAAATAHCAEVKARRHCRRQASKQRSSSLSAKDGERDRSHQRPCPSNRRKLKISLPNGFFRIHRGKARMDLALYSHFSLLISSLSDEWSGEGGSPELTL
jgi:hypothetical protein